MLAIRLQRTGRKGHAQFRVVVQDSRRTPTSGRIVAALGSYDPHAKTVAIDKEKAELYLKNGAQPSERVAYLLKNEGIKLPDWVKISTVQKRDVRNPEKLRKNQPAEEVVAEEPVAEVAEEAKTEDAPVVDSTEADVPEEVAPEEEKKED